jgi:hypothetical protein
MVKHPKDSKGLALIGLSLNLRPPLVIILALGAIGLTDTAMALTISLQQGQNIISQCTGTKWVPGKTGHTTGCIMSDGSGVVCGGVNAAQKKTCDTFRVRSSSLRSIVARGGSARWPQTGRHVGSIATT